MRYIVAIMLMHSAIYAMNDKVIPIVTVTPPSPESTSSTMTDEQLCTFALSNFCKDKAVPMSPEIMPYLARKMRESVHNGQSNEDQDINHLVLQAVNEALAEKEKQITSRISKRHSAYIAIGTGILSTLITALAAIYNTNHNNNC